MGTLGTLAKLLLQQRSICHKRKEGILKRDDHISMAYNGVS